MPGCRSRAPRAASKHGCCLARGSSSTSSAAAASRGSPCAIRLRGALLVPLGLVDAWRIISARRPDLVIGVGGYSSGPVVLAAVARRIPTMVLEQNAVPGLTNRLLAPLVGAAAVTFDSTRPFFGVRAFVSGNPVRPEFFEAVESQQVVSGDGAADVNLLVFGGSQGAHAINLSMCDAAPVARRGAGHRCRWCIRPESGIWTRVRAAYRSAGLRAEVEPFLYDMGRRLNAADLVVCRAGATTLAEIAAAGKASILIPLPTATDDHQRKNAETLGSAGAADVILQSDGDRPRARHTNSCAGGGSRSTGSDGESRARAGAARRRAGHRRSRADAGDVTEAGARTCWVRRAASISSGWAASG